MTGVATPRIAGPAVKVRRELAIGTAVAAAVAATFALAPISHASHEAAALESAGRLAVIGIPVAVGLYAWRRVPFARLGALLIASGLVWLVATFSLANGTVAYSIGRVADWVGWAAILYLVLAFPEGHLKHPLDRLLAQIIGLEFAVLWLPTTLLVEHYPTPVEWVTCSAACPRNAFLVLDREPAVIGHVVVPARELLLVLLLLGVAARQVQRIAAASRIRRRTLMPVLAVTAVVIVVHASGYFVRRLVPDSRELTNAAWLNAFALPEMALAFLAGLIGWQLYVGSSLRRFAGSLTSPAEPEVVRAAFAEAFEDPSLAIVYPVAEDRWAAADGRPAAAPAADVGRSVTELRDPRGNVVAALVHDDALQDERAFINAIASYATLSLENHRLAAEVASLARQLRETEARSMARVDDTREEIERDLHDGAQQRLIALQVWLRLAAERSAAGEPETTEDLNRLGDEVERAIDELRTLAHGVFPAALTDLGPVEALRETVQSAPIPTAVHGANARHNPQLERAVYFCCLEALQNTFKHAPTATGAQVTIATSRREVAFEVVDDGAGFDPGSVPTGTGLRNMRDRLAALGGTFRVDTAPRHGTRISGAIPLTPATSARRKDRTA